MPVAGKTIHVSSKITVSTVRLRSKSCRIKIEAREVVVGSRVLGANLQQASVGAKTRSAELYLFFIQKSYKNTLQIGKVDV